jgi:hypothetical protein
MPPQASATKRAVFRDFLTVCLSEVLDEGEAPFQPLEPAIVPSLAIVFMLGQKNTLHHYQSEPSSKSKV